MVLAFAAPYSSMSRFWAQRPSSSTSFLVLAPNGEGKGLGLGARRKSHRGGSESFLGPAAELLHLVLGLGACWGGGGEVWYGLLEQAEGERGGVGGRFGAEGEEVGGGGSRRTPRGSKGGDGAGEGEAGEISAPAPPPRSPGPPKTRPPRRFRPARRAPLGAAAQQMRIP
jgi:hypothetical protein